MVGVVGGLLTVSLCFLSMTLNDNFDVVMLCLFWKKQKLCFQHRHEINRSTVHSQILFISIGGGQRQKHSGRILAS